MHAATARGAWRRHEEAASFALLVLVVGLLSVLPLARLLAEALAPRGQPSFDALRAAFSNPVTWRATFHSIEVSLGGTLLAALLGGSVALLVALTDVRARSAFVFCFVLPLMIAPQVTALAWLQVAGPSSPLLRAIGLAPAMGSPNPLYSREGIMLLLGISYAPLVFLTLRAGLRRLPHEMIEAARAAGAGHLRIVRSIVVPLMAPPLVAGVALTFVSCIGNFGIPAFLGIPGGYVVLPTLIYQRLSGLGPGVLGEISALSIVAGAIAFVGILVQNAVLGKRDYRLSGGAPAQAPFELGRLRAPVEFAMWLYVAFVLAVPFASLLAISLVPVVGVPLTAASASLDNFRYVLFEFAASHRAFRNSFLLSAGAAFLVVAIGVPLAYFFAWRQSRALRVLNFVAEMPYALPGIVFAIALVLVFLKPIPLLGVSLYNTVWIIFVAYVGRFLVLGLRPVVGGYQQIDRALEEAARAAGAGFVRRIVSIMLPLVAPAAAAGALLVFLMAFGELTLSALLWSSGAETVGTIMFGFQQSGGINYTSAVAVVTIVVTLVLMLATRLFGARLPDGVLPWRD